MNFRNPEAQHAIARLRVALQDWEDPNDAETTEKLKSAITALDTMFSPTSNHVCHNAIDAIDRYACKSIQYGGLAFRLKELCAAFAINEENIAIQDRESD